MYCFVMFFASYVSFVSVKCLLIQYHQAASRNKETLQSFLLNLYLQKLHTTAAFFLCLSQLNNISDFLF